jgi:very-short-patch-repair endonuclease
MVGVSKRNTMQENSSSIEDQNNDQKRKHSNLTLARNLRKRSTDAEKLMWKYLRNRQLEKIKFRRQQPFGPYIVDFISAEVRLVIELDGGQHQNMNVADIKRDDYIKQEGYKVLRFWNNEVFNNTKGVLETIRQEVIRQTPSP